MMLEPSGTRTLMDEILAVDDNVRQVGVIDLEQNTLMTRIRENKMSMMTIQQEDDLVSGIKKLRHSQDAFNSSHGAVSFFQMRRRKINCLIFSFDNLIVYLSCEPTITNFQAAQITDHTEAVVNDILCITSLQKYVSNSKNMIAETVQKVLLDINNETLTRVQERLSNDYNSSLTDCSENPEYLNRILKDLYGDAHKEIARSISNKLAAEHEKLQTGQVEEISNFILDISR